MSAQPITAIIPLVTDAYGAIRVQGSRLLLDTIVIAFQSGATAEEIVHQFASVALSDVYLIIAHYLTHTKEIDGYLAKREAEAAVLKQQIESRSDPAGIRARLLARRDGKQN